jgi:hypothetical protein
LHCAVNRYRLKNSLKLKVEQKLKTAEIDMVKKFYTPEAGLQAWSRSLGSGMFWTSSWSMSCQNMSSSQSTELSALCPRLIWYKNRRKKAYTPNKNEALFFHSSCKTSTFTNKSIKTRFCNGNFIIKLIK